MSAHCNHCGTDLIYTDESWPLGECYPCRLADERDAAREQAEKLAEALEALEWTEEVDVNGEYTTTRWRPESTMKHEVLTLVAEYRNSLPSPGGTSSTRGGGEV